MLSEFIKRERKKLELTQEYTASFLGVSRPTYMLIEQGKRELSITEAKKLSSLFKVHLEDFLAERPLSFEEFAPARDVPRKKDADIRVKSKNLEKFKQVLLYVLNKIGAKPNVGETVLHKLLYFIDFDYYEKYEENLMGGTYIKNHHGPTSLELHPLLKYLEDKGEIEPVKSRYFKFEQKKYLPRRRPDLSVLSAREIEHIEDVLSRLSDKNAREIEKYSHGDIPWITAGENKPLSYESVFYRDEKYSVRTYDDEI